MPSIKLTDKLVKDGVCGVRLRNVVVSVNDSQLCRVLKRMLIEAEKKQHTAESLHSSTFCDGQIWITIWFKMYLSHVLWFDFIA